MLKKCGKTVDPHWFCEVFVRPSERSFNLAELNFRLVEFGPSVGTVVSPIFSDIESAILLRPYEISRTKVETLGAQLPGDTSPLISKGQPVPLCIRRFKHFHDDTQDDMAFQAALLLSGLLGPCAGPSREDVCKRSRPCHYSPHIYHTGAVQWMIAN
jgi:hypothetical protein